MERYDFSGYVTRNDLLCSDGRTIRKDAFKLCHGKTVPLVWNHNHDDPDNVLGNVLLENRSDGVYGYATFNNSDSGKAAKEAVRHGDVRSLSIYANKLKQDEHKNVMHGLIREVSIVMAGANSGAFIDCVMEHGEESEDSLILGYDESIMIHHYAESDETLQHAKDTKKEDEEVAETKKKPEEVAEPEVKEEAKAETKEEAKAETKEEAKAEAKEKTVKEVFDTLNEEQKTVVYALLGQALEDAGVSDEEDDEETEENKTVKHAEGGNNTMNYNVFENENAQETAFLSHSAQEEILTLAKKPTVGSLKHAMELYADDHKESLAHGFNDITALFPEHELVKPGAPEIVREDNAWVAQVMKKAVKSPVARVRTRQANLLAKDLQAKGYDRTKNGGKKALAEKIDLITRTVEPQTVYVRDELHRDDIVDITDFDVVAYQKSIMKANLEETVALAALVGDGRVSTDPDKIKETHIVPVYHDGDVYTIKVDVDVAGMAAKLQGTSTGANFGEDFIFTEAFITKAMHAREQYRGKGQLDLFCTPNTLNRMLLARDMNGRRIYDSAADVAKALNVANIFTIPQLEGVTRTDDEDQEHKLLGLFVNMGNYQFGCAKGGEITSFEDFDIDFNNYKYLMETRLSGALVMPYSAIAIEEAVVAG